MRLFRPKKGYLLLKIKKKGYRTPSVSYMYPGHDEEFWLPSYAPPYGSAFGLNQQQPTPTHGHATRAAVGAALPSSSSGMVTRSAYDPPMLKKAKLAEALMGDEDAAALLTDLGRSSSPPSSPRNSSSKVRALDSDDDDNGDSKEEMSGLKDVNGRRGEDTPTGTEMHLRSRRESRNRPLFSNTNATPVKNESTPTAEERVLSSLNGAARAGTPPTPNPGQLGMLFPNVASPNPFYHQHAQTAANLPFWSSPEVYKLYTQPRFGALDAKSVPFGSNPAAATVDPATAFQHQQLLLQQQYLAQQLQQNPAAAQAFLQQQHLAQLAFQQQLQAAQQHHAQQLAQQQLAQQQLAQQQQQQASSSTSSPSRTTSSTSLKAADNNGSPAGTSSSPSPSNLSSSGLPLPIKSEHSSSASGKASANGNSDSRANHNLAANGSSTSGNASSSSNGGSAPAGSTSEAAIKDENWMDADGSESADTEDGSVTPEYPRRGRPRRVDDPMAIADANAMSKRNKFFYKQLRDLDTGSATPEIGFVNDLFFVMDPKLHVGPSNRDGTFEKRVRLHFMEYIELKIPKWTKEAPATTSNSSTSSVTGAGAIGAGESAAAEGGPGAAETLATVAKEEPADHTTDLSTSSSSVSPSTPTVTVSSPSASANASSPSTSTLWLCWGTLLDSSKTPIFRRSSQFYRIPGNQSAVLRSHSRAPHDWDVADEASAAHLRVLATTIANTLNELWDGANIASAIELVDTLKLVLPTSTPLDEKGDYMPPSTDTLFKELLENCLNRSPAPTPNAAAMDISDDEPLEPRAAALAIWRNLGLRVPENVADVAWTEEPIALSSSLETKLVAALGLIEPHLESQIKIFRIFVAPEGHFSFADLELAMRRFGGRKMLITKMLDVLSTGAFNGTLNSASTRSLLQDLPDGSYLIRYSQHTPENFVLCSRVQNSIAQINKIFNQPSAGLEIEIDGRLCQVSQWSSLLKSCPAMTTPVVAPQNATLFKEHGLPIVELLADRRFQIPAESFAAIPARARQSVAMESDTSSESSSEEQAASGERLYAANKIAAQAAAASLSNSIPSNNGNLAASVAAAAAAAAAANKSLSHEESVSLAKHELEAKLNSERKSDILSYLAKLRAESRIDPALFQAWCLFVSSPQSKDIAPQLHSLLLAFREEPELWISFANDVIPRKLTV